MKLKTFTTFPTGLILLPLVFSTICPGQSNHSKLIGNFSGTWKENQAKRKIGSGFSLRFRRAADGIEELRGPEARPLVQPLKFGTKPYAVDNSKNTIAWKQIDANHFQRQLFERESSSPPGTSRFPRTARN